MSIVVLAGLGLIIWTISLFFVSVPTEGIPSTHKKYINKEFGFSIVIPSDISPNDRYRYVGARTGIVGVSFPVPRAFARGTNLVTDTRLSFETIPGKNACEPGDFLATIQKEETIVEGDIAYHVLYTENRSAGHVYEEVVYLLPSCRAMRYFIHHTTTGNDDVRTGRNFDRKNLLMMFGEIRRSYAVLSSFVMLGVTKDDRIVVDVPVAGATITSPLIVRGSARGSWYFEASFPVRLRDANGVEMAVTHAEAQGDWMTNDPVPFEAVLKFEKSTTKTGVLIFEKDNPSGLPEYAAQIEIPVVFE